MATTLFDYVGRSYDYLAFQNVKEEGSAQLDFSLFSEESSGQIATGIQKLSQRWLLEFLTEAGSMPGLPGRGTNFMRRVRQGVLRTYSGIWTEFTFSAYTAAVNLRREETNDWADDERYANAQLLSLAVLPSYANLSVQITSRAGASRKVIMPVQTLPQTIVDS